MGPIPECPRIVALAVAIAVLAGCASDPVRMPNMPDESMLADAKTMLEQARDAGAAGLAPMPLRDAERRLAGARSILYRVAAASRNLREPERQRVGWLADEAWLDARLALAQTRQIEVERKLAKLEAELAAPPAKEGS